MYGVFHPQILITADYEIQKIKQNIVRFILKSKLHISCHDLNLRTNRKSLDILQVYEPDRVHRILSIVMIAVEINNGTVKGRRCKLKTLFNEISEVEG
jgi:hypothetical protein